MFPGRKVFTDNSPDLLPYWIIHPQIYLPGRSHAEPDTGAVMGRIWVNRCESPDKPFFNPRNSGRCKKSIDHLNGIVKVCFNLFIAFIAKNSILVDNQRPVIGC